MPAAPRLTPATKGGGVSPPYVYQLLPGNESSLIRECFDRRPWWTPAAEEVSVAPAAARPTHACGSGSGGGSSLDKRRTDQPGSSQPTSGSGRGRGAEAVRYHLWWGANGQPFAWNAFPFAGVGRSLVNRLPGHREICTKTRLAVNLRTYAATHMKKRHGDEEDGDGDGDELFFPLTFVVHAGRRTSELDAFKKIAAKASGKAASTAKKSAEANKKAAPADEPSRKASSCGVWIVKPGALNRGRGIEVFSSVSAIEKHLEAQEYGSMWVVQKYIEAPILVHGRKFDIRQFAMVAPDSSVYMYKDSYVRTCSAEYDVNNLDVKAIHLTNDAVQKVLESYGEHEDANKLDFGEFQRALDADHAEGKQRKVDFHNQVWPAMVRAVQHVFAATLNGLNPDRPERKEHCFELFGLDFMLDERGAPVLIEVNTSPALFRHGRCLTEMMPKMMEECVQKCVDTVFPPPPDTPPETSSVHSEKLERWLRLDVAPVKFTPVDVGGGARRTAGGAASFQPRTSPFQPGGAGTAKSKSTETQRSAKMSHAGSFK